MESDEFGELKWLWLTRLRSTRAANTVAAYQSAVKMLEQWCEQTGHKPGVDRELIEAWTADSLAAGLDPGTAELRCTALRSLSAYLAAQGATDGDLLRDLRAPKRIKKIVPKLGPGELAALIAACKGTTFADRRDTAMVRLMGETGVRADELLSMNLADVNVSAGIAKVRKAKGGKQREVPFGGKTGEAVGWYLRARRQHPKAALPALWLSHVGRLSYGGAYKVIGARARKAGITDFHLHRIRHTFASQWLDAGGTEGGLMSIAGWSSREMLDRYVEDSATSRAIDEARKLGIGDV